ncbi:glycosyltransferase family 4 protein [Candidatus Poribacteria bacterium]|nr:glycosyltransferase family 4 protein [Candidatus Poribacteria bacterium]
MKKKLLLYTDQYPNPREPNRAVFTRSLAQSLEKHLDIVVISPIPWFPNSPVLRRLERYKCFADVPRESRDGGIKAYYPRYPMIPKMGLFQPASMFTATWPLIRRLHEQEKFDIVNGQFVFPSGIVASWIGKALNIPVVISALGCDINLYADYPFRKRMIGPALDASPLVVAVSRRLRERIIALGIGEEKVAYIPNGVDTQIFRPYEKEAAKREERISPGTKTVLFVGRLSEEKGIDVLIRAVGKVRAEMDDFLVLIVGEGGRRYEYERLVHLLDLSRWIRFCGGVPHADLPKWYALADVFCLPSLREGMPNVVLESLACGRPVVASDVGALPDLVDGSNGRLFRSGDPADLAEKLRSALTGHWDAGAIRSSVTKYSWENSAFLYMQNMRKAGVV